MDAARRAAIDAQRALLEVAFKTLRNSRTEALVVEPQESVDAWTPTYLLELEQSYDVAGTLTGAHALAYDADAILKPVWLTFMSGEIDDLPDAFFDSDFQSKVAQAEQSLEAQRRRGDGPSVHGDGGPAFADVGGFVCVPRETATLRSVLLNTSKAARG